MRAEIERRSELPQQPEVVRGALVVRAERERLLVFARREIAETELGESPAEVEMGVGRT